MIISYELALTLNDILYKSGKRMRMRVYDKQFCIFTEEELASITEITINNFSDISDLVYLPNLRVLKIISLNYNNMIPELDLRDSNDVNHITDFSVIGKLPQLEELYIENDVNITSLDVSSLANLTKIVLTNNVNLRELVGLEGLKKLNKIFLCGNNIESDFDFKKYAANTLLAKENILDISMYLPMIGKNRTGAKALVDLEVKGASNFCFAEKSGFLEYTHLSVRSLYDMYAKLDIFFRRNGAYALSDEEKCLFVYRYILNNIVFSSDSIAKRDADYHSIIYQYNAVPNAFRQKLTSIHNSYYAYYFKSANCEGIVNLSVFMLRMLGIDAFDVHCHDLRGMGTLANNHAIVRTIINGSVTYTDPTLAKRAKDKSKMFMRTFEEMSKYHMLDAYESLLNSSHSKEKVNNIC